MKPFTSLACLLLAAIAVLQLARLLLGWDIVVNGYAVPLWASGVAAILTGGLSLLAWRESPRERSPPISPDLAPWALFVAE